MSSMWSSLWCGCLGGQSSHDAFDVNVPAVPALKSTDLLRVAVWNAAGYDQNVIQRYQNQVGKKHPQNCRKSNDAAKCFRDKNFDVVIIPECDDKNTAYGDHNTEAAFKKQGFALVTAARKRLSQVDKHTCIFYNADKLEIPKESGEEWGSKDCMPGTSTHHGKVVGRAFRMKNETRDWILITAVHAGHYGNSKDLVDDFKAGRDAGNVNQAKKDIQALREFQNEFLTSWGGLGSKNGQWSKVIVAGDFNELGNLISEDSALFCPLPKDFESKGTDNIGVTCSNHGKYDHIWWATSHPKMHVKGGQSPIIKIGDKFGSDHSCVMAENI